MSYSSELRSKYRKTHPSPGFTVTSHSYDLATSLNQNGDRILVQSVVFLTYNLAHITSQFCLLQMKRFGPRIWLFISPFPPPLPKPRGGPGFKNRRGCGHEIVEADFHKKVSFMKWSILRHIKAVQLSLNLGIQFKIVSITIFFFGLGLKRVWVEAVHTPTTHGIIAWVSII